jgi:hypothetical protein
LTGYGIAGFVAVPGLVDDNARQLDDDDIVRDDFLDFARAVLAGQRHDHLATDRREKDAALGKDRGDWI